MRYAHNTSSCRRDRYGMFKRTRAFYLIWLIQIFSAINTRNKESSLSWWTAAVVTMSTRPPLLSLDVSWRPIVTPSQYMTGPVQVADLSTSSQLHRPTIGLRRILTLLTTDCTRAFSTFKWSACLWFLSPRYFTSGNTIRHCPAPSAVFWFFFPRWLLFTCRFLSLMRVNVSLCDTRSCCDSSHPPEGAASFRRVQNANSSFNDCPKANLNGLHRFNGNN